MKFNSIRFKINILYTVILVVILCLYSGILFYALRTILYRDLDESLMVKAGEVGDILREYEKVENQPLSFLSELYGDGGTVFHKQVIDDMWHSEVKTLNLKNDYIHILTSKGQLVLSSENVKAEVAALFNQQFSFVNDRVLFNDIRDENHHLRVINFPLLHDKQPWLIIQIGTPLNSLVRTLDKLMIFIIVTVVLVLILTSFLGNVFVRGVLTPVQQIAETANNISHKDLHVRVVEKQTDEEIRYLVQSFNTMLSRLEKSFGHINEFSSLVAHELKTPLAILRGEMELALSEKRSLEEHRRVLEAGMEEVNRLIKIVKDLLLLANLDYRTDIFKFEKIDMVEYIKDICKNGEILAVEKNIEVFSEIPHTELYVDGDKVHLRRLFFNLINNAIKFTPLGGKIHIVLKDYDRRAVISIADTGIGIAQEDLSKLFTKFFRITKEQTISESGSGLGLSIAQSIAKAHQGIITVQSEVNKGSVFTVSLPLI